MLFKKKKKLKQLMHVVSVLLAGAEGGVLVTKALDTTLDMSGTTLTDHTKSLTTYQRGYGSKQRYMQTSTPTGLQ